MVIWEYTLKYPEIKRHMYVIYSQMVQKKIVDMKMRENERDEKKW